jgi:naringenin degradation protein FdeH
MPKPIRRVVTGHDAAGRSVFVMDAAAPHVYRRSPGSAVVTELWETRSAPADNRGTAEVTDHPFRLPPPRNGTVFRIIEYPPDSQRLAALASEASGQHGNSIVRAPDTRPEAGSSARTALAQERASGDDGSGHISALDRGSPRHPGFHKTSSTDYAIVLSGEIYALMDQGEVKLTAGDVLIQRGTNHAWSNRTDQPAYVAFVLIDAAPV